MKTFAKMVANANTHTILESMPVFSTLWENANIPTNNADIHTKKS
jgi:hypothetical protein